MSSSKNYLEKTTYNFVAPKYLPLEAKWCIAKNKCYFLEVADTKEEKLIGLMGRSMLKEMEGMLFVFDPSEEVRFWMHKTFIPLDIIFINKGYIIFLKENLAPCPLDVCPVFKSPGLVDKVIEIRAGEIKRMGIEIGDRVSIYSKY